MDIDDVNFETLEITRKVVLAFLPRGQDAGP